MKITNKEGLPAIVVRAIEFDEHKKADYSATQILNSPRIVHLSNRYSEKITVDAVDRSWILLGKAMHYYLEKFAKKHELEESYIEVDIAGRILSGSSDLFSEGKITDYKVTSAWSLVFGSRIDDWTAQLNIYAYLFRSIGFEVNELEILTILRDWNYSKTLQDKNYPQVPITVIPIDLWSKAKQKKFIAERITLLKKFENTDDEGLPECSDEERWSKPTKYAVMKEGRKSAVAVTESAVDAKAMIGEQETLHPSNKFYVITRPGESVRCKRYCNVKDFCSQYQNTQ